jgi:solute carrier family 15 (peptide/histidine transporter), member 3/4
MSTNLVNYMESRLGLGNAVAANTVTNWSGTCYITPLIGAFFADAYMGRYWTISSFMIIYILVSKHRPIPLFALVFCVAGVGPDDE